MARDMTPTMLNRTNAPYRRISSLPAIACLPPPESYIAPASLCMPPCNPIRTPMPMQSASAKMIRRPVEANAGLEVCISAFEPRLLPALARYYRRSNSPVRLGQVFRTISASQGFRFRRFKSLCQKARTDSFLIPTLVLFQRAQDQGRL